jgi:hypothetical protein
MQNNTIQNIATQVANRLGIDANQLIGYLPRNLLVVQIQNQQLLDIIQNLLTSDDEINQFGTRHGLGQNYTELKNSLGRLQLLALAKNLARAESCDDVLNTFIQMMNNKIGQVNQVLQTNLQFGGNQINYYKKYKKYKKKYFVLKKMYDNI